MAELSFVARVCYSRITRLFRGTESKEPSFPQSNLDSQSDDRREATLFMKFEHFDVSFE